MPRVLREFALLFALTALFILSVNFGCSKGGNKTDGGNNGECKGEGDCWRKVCPQKEEFEFEECLKQKLSTAIPPGGDKPHIPEYQVCNAGKCEQIPAEQLAAGQVNVIPSDPSVKIQWLRLYIFPPKDWNGNPLNCQKLKQVADKDPAKLMSREMGRYYPPRDYTSPITTPVQGQGSSYPLLFLGDPPKVPAGSDRIIVVQGFCDPPSGRPEADTPHKWWACKEGVTLKPGDKNSIDIELKVKVGESCR